MNPGAHLTTQHETVIDYRKLGDQMRNKLCPALAIAACAAMGAFALIGWAAEPGLAQGPSPALLAEQGWTCVTPPVPDVGMACFNPGLGRPPIPPVEDGRPSYTAMLWTPSGELLGHAHLIRPDLYAGQPCPQTGGLYVLNPRLGYYECRRTSGGSR